MSTERVKTIAAQIMAALDGRDLDGVTAHCAPTCRFHGWGPEPMAVAGYKATMSSLLTAFPDSRFLVADVIAEGNRVAVLHSMRGTHQANFQGVPATDKAVVINAIVIMRFENDEAIEMWLNADFMGLMQQLGVIPA